MRVNVAIILHIFKFAASSYHVGQLIHVYCGRVTYRRAQHDSTAMSIYRVYNQIQDSDISTTVMRIIL